MIPLERKSAYTSLVRAQVPPPADGGRRGACAAFPAAGLGGLGFHGAGHSERRTFAAAACCSREGVLAYIPKVSSLHRRGLLPKHAFKMRSLILSMESPIEKWWELPWLCAGS